MPTKAKTPKAKTPKAKVKCLPTPVEEPVRDTWSSPPPATTEERLERIKALEQRIGEHIRFIRTASAMPGTSLEVREKAVAVFYECLHAMEQKLDRIQDQLRME